MLAPPKMGCCPAASHTMRLAVERSRPGTLNVAVTGVLIAAAPDSEMLAEGAFQAWLFTGVRVMRNASDARPLAARLVTISVCTFQVSVRRS